MPYKYSTNIALEAPDAEAAVGFYRDVLGLPIKGVEGDSTAFEAGPITLYVDPGDRKGPVMEFLVPDIEEAKRELVGAGCRVVRWEGLGRPCYLSDPYGLTFNVYQQPEAFEDG